MGVMHGFEEKESIPFAEHSVHLRKNPLEFVGHGLVEVSFEMDFLTELTSEPAVGIALIASLMRAPLRSYPLIVAGRPIGSWSSLFVLTDRSAAHYWYSGKGTIQNATVKVSLKECVAISA